MPTGYTDAVQNGGITEFPDFAMHCARAFGALIVMRDEPHGTPIPTRFEPSTKYHDEALDKAHIRLGELRSMDLPAMREAAQQAYAAAVKSDDEYLTSKRQSRRRYEAMLAKVEAWAPPTEEHAELKTFMAEQLRSSINFDCNEKRYGEAPTKLDPAEWRDREVAKAERDVAYHMKARAEEVERTEGRNRWLAELRASLQAAA